MAEILSKVYLWGAVVLLFSATIFVHEFGHFWMALRRRMRVDAFALGFGPKLFAWVRNGVEYSIRWIPAGGFVKLPQMITSEALEGKTSDGVQLPPVSAFSKILVSLAGPLMNVLFAFLISGVLYFVGLPMLVNPPIIGPVEPDSPEGRLGIRQGDRVVEVNGAKVKSWQDISLETGTARTNVLPVVIERDGKQTTFQLEAKANPVLGLKSLNLEPQDRPIVGLVESGMPAQAAGFQPGDKFLAFAGVPVLSQEFLTELIKKSEGRQVEALIERDGGRLTLSVTPQFDKKENRGRIGIGFAGGIYQVRRPGPSPVEQITEKLQMMGRVLDALVHSRQTGVGAKDLSGPVGIIPMLAVQVKTDWRLALNFLVMLNINLAILNLLPIPVLDGGHIVMSLYEIVTRKRVSLRVQEYATTAFAVLLISFMLYVTFFDIRRLDLFRAMLRQPNRVEEVSSPQEAPSLGPAPTPAPAPGPAR